MPIFMEQLYGKEDILGMTNIFQEGGPPFLLNMFEGGGIYRRRCWCKQVLGYKNRCRLF